MKRASRRVVQDGGAARRRLSVAALDWALVQGCRSFQLRAATSLGALRHAQGRSCFNNSLLGFVSMELKAGGYLDSNVDLAKTDFAAIAKGAGIFGIRVEESEDVAAALKQAFDHPGPALVDVVTSKHELAMPPSVELAQAKGFSLYMLRAILNGRGDEIVELARTNLR
ncbi:hypothetical protein HDG32_006769 [Paraburkholderia sp. CI2]|nr:hypothetical protein [Paraburkholderia sp. CI2]